MSQVDSETVDIAIVGAGLVGASLAVRLGQSEVCKDLSIALIDANSPPAPLVSSQTSDFDPRVVALTHRSQLLLAELGVWSSLLASEGGHGPCPYTDMRVWDGEGTGKIHFHCSDVGAESLGYIVENNLLISRLNGRVAGLERLKSFWGRALTTLKMSGSGVKLAFGKAPSLRARLVVGADGANSQVRALGGFDTRQWQYGQRANHVDPAF